MSGDAYGGRVLRGKRCLGFGEFDRKCENMAGPNPYWCPRCDKLRIEHIDRQMYLISEAFGARNE